MAGEDVNMIIVHCGSSDQKSVGMECSRSNWSRSVPKKARIWFEIGHRLATVDIENLDAMLLRSTGNVSFDGTRSRTSDTYVAKTGACS